MIFFLFLLLSLFSRSYAIEEEQEVLEFDESYRSQDDDESLQAKLHSPAHIERFPVATDHRLTFIAVEHIAGSSPENSRIVLRILRSEITPNNQSQKPDAVIIEGLPASFGYSDPNYSRHVRHDPIRSEAEYAAKFASEKDIPFMGGEPTDEEILQIIESPPSGMIFERPQTSTGDIFNKEDYYYYKLFRQIASAAGQVPLSSAVEQALNGLPPQTKRAKYPLSLETTINNLKAWYLKWNYKNLDFQDSALLQETAPSPSRGSNTLLGTQKITAFLTEIRDANLRKTIKRALAKHRNVVVVYGKSHLLYNYPLLSRLFDEATIIKSIEDSVCQKEEKSELEKTRDEWLKVFHKFYFFVP